MKVKVIENDIDKSTLLFNGKPFDYYFGKYKCTVDIVKITLEYEDFDRLRKQLEESFKYEENQDT